MPSVRKRNRNWYFQYVDADGRRVERKGCTDKRETKRMAYAAEAQAAKIRAGTLDRRAVQYAEHNARPLAEHLDDFHAHLIAKGNTRKHADLFVRRARRVAELAKAERFGDLTASKVQAALAMLRDSGRSLGTCNHHRVAIRGFTRWAWKDGRLADDPLVGVSGFNANLDRRHDRRTIGRDELAHLIRVAHSGRPYRRMSGPARALVYRLAVQTGLRYSEIKSATLSSFDLGPAPTVTVTAAYTKNRRSAVIPLPADLAADLARSFDGRDDDGPAFPLPDRGADMLKIDLEAAGIPYRDAGGRVFDFHALRCMLATLADQAGVSPRTVQHMMRHSTLELTGRYTRPRAADVEAGFGALPALTAATSDVTTAPIDADLADHLPTEAVVSGRTGTHIDVKTPSDQDMNPPRKTNPEATLDAPGCVVTPDMQDSGGGTRTPDTRIMIPLL